MDKRVVRLGELMAGKYKAAAEYPPSKPEFPLPDVEFPLPDLPEVRNSIRNELDSLWNIPNSTYNIIRACADSGADAPKNEEEKKAVAGFKFCQELMSIVDYLKAHKDKMSLSKIREALESVVSLIQSNMLQKDTDRQFPHVISLIDMILPRSKRHLYDEKIKKQQHAKARAGLSRMMSVSLKILNQMNALGGASEQKGNFDPQTSKLSNDEIVKFVRHHGDTYGITDVETFQTVIDVNPDLERPLTILVRALDRGRVPRGADKIKPIIQNILSKRQQATQTNVPALEQEKPGPNPLTLFEEEGDAWDAKMASKYNDLALGIMLRKGNL